MEKKTGSSGSMDRRVQGSGFRAQSTEGGAGGSVSMGQATDQGVKCTSRGVGAHEAIDVVYLHYADKANTLPRRLVFLFTPGINKLGTPDMPLMFSSYKIESGCKTCL